ncbi:DNA-3-methyladenine glycosylase II [Malassezia sp. CBS 17886]|nr:DNA-3-methyladenine glycosylase II [Malassezia sp. CBS 17886]
MPRTKVSTDVRRSQRVKAAAGVAASDGKMDITVAAAATAAPAAPPHKRGGTTAARAAVAPGASIKTEAGGRGRGRGAGEGAGAGGGQGAGGDGRGRHAPPATPPRKRGSGAASPARRKKAHVDSGELPPLLPAEEISKCTTLAQPVLPFSLADARAHLCRIDPRFQPLFEQLELRAYEEMIDGTVKEINLFRVITMSILGQQISWLAARAIVYKFCRIFDPSLPAPSAALDLTAMDRDKLSFPDPLQMLQATDEQLRGAGLSTAKVRYIRDLARHFADGRLDIRRIVHMDYDECIAELTRVHGVGVWTSEMLLMFALRHPNVLPTGDLGVQRGMLHFYLAGRNGPRVNDRKRKCVDLPVLHDPDGHTTLPLPPAGALSHTAIRARVNGSKTKRKMYLDEAEMQALAEPWAPYRSVASMFMWSLAAGDGGGK